MAQNDTSVAGDLHHQTKVMLARLSIAESAAAAVALQERRFEDVEWHTERLHGLVCRFAWEVAANGR